MLFWINFSFQPSFNCSHEINFEVHFSLCRCILCHLSNENWWKTGNGWINILLMETHHHSKLIKWKPGLSHKLYTLFEEVHVFAFGQMVWILWSPGLNSNSLIQKSVTSVIVLSMKTVRIAIFHEIKPSFMNKHHQ